MSLLFLSFPVQASADDSFSENGLSNISSEQFLSDDSTLDISDGEGQTSNSLDETESSDSKDVGCLESEINSSSVNEDEASNLLIPESESMVSESVETNLVTYTGHQQTYGNLPDCGDGEELGVTGQGKRMEAISIEKGQNLSGIEGSIVYHVHGQSYGTQEWKKDGELAGLEGQAKRIEAIQIYLTGQLANQYDVYYRTHIQSHGWMQWVKGSEDESAWSGSMGLSLRVESVQIELVEKGAAAPDDSDAQYPCLVPEMFGSVNYEGTQQDLGRQELVSDGATLGTTGKSQSLDTIQIFLSNDSPKAITGGVEYRVHSQSIGWQEWVQDGSLAGTEGKRI